MGLFDWLSGLWGSNGSEVNQESENTLARDGVEGINTAAVEHDEILNQTHHLNAQTQDALETDLEAMEFEDAVSDE
ncbi:hypothetical protein ABF87_14515 [Nitrosomonas sp. JL21]|uniref:hypothetical protein n=1 Tax=Nitrosomonas sp. JL21 TaxID=153949 RepID=UPI00136AE256|nr:hypothetical protein [Nitrosomonas sp. JL21]MBL8498959.1 hypothetical protein [Nitrosomonas sp.]MCC7091085.1 hypothetical protein [Nitrosomonas sp.]MXS79148.1 hypothetical protein [Nitrosomonas sp. JL21]